MRIQYRANLRLKAKGKSLRIEDCECRHLAPYSVGIFRDSFWLRSKFDITDISKRDVYIMRRRKPAETASDPQYIFECATSGPLNMRRGDNFSYH